jgi:hypothetical protein
MANKHTGIVQTDDETNSELLGTRQIRKASVDDATFPTLPHQSQTQEPDIGSQQPLSMRKSTMAEYDVIN